MCILIKQLLQEFTPEQTHQQYTLYRDVSTELVENFKATYDSLVSSHAAYDSIQDSLTTELENLIDVNFEEVLTKLDDVETRLDGLSNEFPLENYARDIYSDLRDSYAQSKTAADSARSVHAVHVRHFVLYV